MTYLTKDKQFNVIFTAKGEFPNSLFRNKLELGKKYKVVWEGWYTNPPWFDNGSTRKVYILDGFPPKDTFSGMWEERNFEPAKDFPHKIETWRDRV